MVTARTFFTGWLARKQPETSSATLAFYTKTVGKFMTFLGAAAEAMARAVCGAVRVPAGLAGPAALGILSGCIGAGAEIVSGHNRRARANFYLLVSAASSSGKSETLRLLAEPLHAREQAALEARRRDVLPGALAEAELLDVEITTLKRQAGKLDAGDADERARLRALLQEKKWRVCWRTPR